MTEISDDIRPWHVSLLSAMPYLSVAVAVLFLLYLRSQGSLDGVDAQSALLIIGVFGITVWNFVRFRKMALKLKLDVENRGAKIGAAAKGAAE